VARPSLVNADWNFWPDGLSPAAIWAACAAMGFDGLELGVYDPDVELSSERVAEVTELVGAHGLGVRAVLFSMPPARWPDGGLGSDEHAPAAIAAIVETGRRAADVGAGILGVWPGADRDGWSRTVDSVGAITQALVSSGVTVAVEPKPGQVVGDTADALRLCDEVGDGRLGVLLDTAHAFAGGEDVAALPARIGDRLVHVHLGDSDGGDADADLPPGSAHDFGPFLAGLERAGYAGVLSFDLYGAVSSGGYTGEAASRQALAHIAP
jgi:sugar phosphate isomerase/epimerase